MNQGRRGLITFDTRWYLNQIKLPTAYVVNENWTSSLCTYSPCVRYLLIRQQLVLIKKQKNPHVRVSLFWTTTPHSVVIPIYRTWVFCVCVCVCMFLLFFFSPAVSGAGIWNFNNMDRLLFDKAFLICFTKQCNALHTDDSYLRYKHLTRSLVPAFSPLISSHKWRPEEADIDQHRQSNIHSMKYESRHLCVFFLSFFIIMWIPDPDFKELTLQWGCVRSQFKY